MIMQIVVVVVVAVSPLMSHASFVRVSQVSSTTKNALLYGTINVVPDAAAASTALRGFTVSAAIPSHRREPAAEDNVSSRGGQYALHLEGTSRWLGQAGIYYYLSVRANFGKDEDEAIVWREALTSSLANGYADERNVTLSASVLEFARREAREKREKRASESCGDAHVQQNGSVVQQVALTAAIAMIIVLSWKRGAAMMSGEDGGGDQGRRADLRDRGTESALCTPSRAWKRLAGLSTSASQLTDTNEPGPEDDGVDAEEDDDGERRGRRGTRGDAAQRASRGRRADIPYWLRSSTAAADGDVADGDVNGEDTECTSPQIIIDERNIEDMQATMKLLQHEYGEHDRAICDSADDDG